MKPAKLLVGGAVVAGLVFIPAGVASAAPSNNGCPTGWTIGPAVSPDAQARDRNGDGLVCGKFVNGQGNGNYTVPNAVVKDNNNP